MNIVAICGASFATATESVVGVKPLTSPPMFDSEFNKEMVGHPDVLYLHLHGQPGDPYLLGDLGVAVTADQLRGCNLNDTIVIALSCYVGEVGHPVLEALLDAGARYVIAAPGENFTGRSMVIGADVLAREFLHWIGWKVTAKHALSLAKTRVRTELGMLRLQLSLATNNREALETNIGALLDSLGFAIFTRRDDGQTITA